MYKEKYSNQTRVTDWIISKQIEIYVVLEHCFFFVWLVIQTENGNVALAFCPSKYTKTTAIQDIKFKWEQQQQQQKQYFVSNANKVFSNK